MDAGPDAQQGANKSDVDTTYHVDVWLPDESESGYPELSDASKEVKTALDKELADVQRKNNGIEIRFEHKRYKRDTKNLDIDGRSVAAISFSEDFAEQCNSNDVAVLAMMGGVLPVGKSFFRMGFSVETIAAILGDQIIKDGRVSHVFLIRVDNNLGNEFERAFSRAVNAPSPERSLDILKIDENGTPITTKIQITQTDEKVVRNTPTNEGVISKWLEKRPRNQGLRSVVIYGYWEQYWDIVKEVLRWEGFDKKTDWLYVESNYPLLTPVLRNMQSGGDLTNIVEIEEADKLNVKDSESDRIQVDFGQIPSEEKGDNGKIKINLNPSDTQSSVEETVDDTQVTGAKTKGFKDKTKKLTEDAHVQGLGRVRCFTGKLVERESSFITFAKETVRLLCAAIRYAHDQLEKEKKQEDVEEEIIRRRRRERICEFLVRSKFYASEHLGSFFFRKDGELFFPLYHYNGKLERQGIVRESCCKGDEFTKEAIADQLLQLSNSLNKITRAEIPRNLKVGNSDGAKKVFEEFSKIIADISKGIEIKFVSYYPNTERLFYTWTDTQEGNVDKTERFINVSIFDDVCKKIQGVIQINLKDFDLEDNDAYRVYLVYERAKKIFDVLTLAEWWNRQYDALRSKILDGNEGWESGVFPVKAVVFTKSRIRKQDGQTWEGLSEDEYKNIIGKAKYVHYYRDDHGSKSEGSKFEFDEILRGLCQLLDCRQDPSNSKSTTDSKSNAGFLYYIPEYVLEDDNSSKTSDAGDGQGGIVMTTCCKLSLFDLQIIENMVSRIFSKLKTCLAEHDVLLSNIKSAIGSIMSRNGSHNIGSHVLAALSHNVGTMPDDRVLYQYIQHRMDYIATATTDFPVWKQPLYLVGNLMKTFLMQRHLLDHITGSEGLRAYQFQNDKVDTITKGCQPNTIRIHIRRINDADSGWGEANNFSTNHPPINFIGYPDSLCNAEAMKHDLELAIPGGIVGQHAFFTIIENVLRNAAKHEWAKLRNTQKDENVESDDKAPVEMSPYLDVYIDFKDKPDAGVVEFVVWTDSEYSRLHYPANKFKDKVGRLSLEDALDRLAKDDMTGVLNTDGLEMHQKLQLMMARSLINKEGQLRKENWGLAEMRISAGFLNVVDISIIGGLGDDKSETMKLISPAMILCNDHYCLGYHFHVPKPRELLIIVPGNLSLQEEQGLNKDALVSAHAKLMRYGIGIVTEEDVRKESEGTARSDRLSYAYALLNKFNREQMCTWKIPFRLVTISNEKLCPSQNLRVDRRADFTGDNNFFSPVEFNQWLNSVLASDDRAKERAQNILSAIYDSWTRHLKYERFGRKRKELPPIVIDLEGGGANSEGSLISEADLLKLVLGECFNTSVLSFNKSPLSSSADSSLVRTLEAIVTLKPRAVDLESIKIIKYTDKDTHRIIEKTIGNAKGLIIAQLRAWCKALGDNADAKKIGGDLFLIGLGHESGRTPGLMRFVDFLAGTILNQTKALMTKYEERFVTLPEDILVAKRHNAGGKELQQVLLDGQQMIEEIISDELKSEVLKDHMNGGVSEILAYWRHENSAVPRLIKEVKNGKEEEEKIRVLYREPLSGAQSYLNSFEMLYGGDATEIQCCRFVLKLLETGLARVLLIDERVKKFEDEHSDVKATFDDIGIVTLDDTSMETEALFKQAQDGETRMSVSVGDCPVADFDIVVIHQGIIDKKLKDHNNPDKIREFIETLKAVIRYVVVTTGRGNPANIPNDVRVLPFSVIESTLFKKYPEKLILVDAVMNLLPSSRKEK